MSGRNRLAMLFQAFQRAGDGLIDVGIRLFPAYPFGVAPRLGRTMNHKNTNFIRFDDYPEFHQNHRGFHTALNSFQFRL